MIALIDREDLVQSRQHHSLGLGLELYQSGESELSTAHIDSFIILSAFEGGRTLQEAPALTFLL